MLEVPTPRWVAYDRARLGVDVPDKVPLVHQERAYSSPNLVQTVKRLAQNSLKRLASAVEARFSRRQRLSKTLDRGGAAAHTAKKQTALFV